MDSINTNPLMRSLLTSLCVILIAFVGVKIASEFKSMSYIGKSTNMPSQINVSGKGEVVATPDIATFTFTVSEEAAKVSDAQTKATQKMDSILAYVKKAGVEDKDVKTLSYDIYPRYDYTNGTAYVAGKQILAGYVVSQTIQIKVRKLEDAGTLLSGIGEFGATNVSGLSFSVDKQDELLREARDKAIEDAKAQAEELAASLGVKIVGITSFYEQSPYQPYYMAKDVGMGGDAVAQEVSNQVSLPTGESKIISNVTISYEIK